MIKLKKQQQKTSCNDSGFTIIESLVAIIVVAILLTAIAPVLVFSTATRVQARRVELAAQAAKTFIDGIRSGATTRSGVIIAVPNAITPILAAPSTDVTRNLVDAPGDYLIDTTKMPVPDNTTKGSLYCFNNDGSISNPDCTTNTDKLFYIQARRIVQNTAANDGYRLTIRVYRADVDFTKTLTASTIEANSTSPAIKKTQNPYTGGLGDRQAPLLEMTTDIANSSTSFSTLCQRLGVATNKACN
ncbi:hormogonium polysaccharide secretion pseudopilin HpsB [Anabaena subtropica]|uniref:Type II secretion system protein n=1 Tax=Anabaena subtropica FACHB-260 TaxID=2692884 RepID=A0ABR8CMJ6_9NOST|nr:hormogonium polysaccharide secretion pseudopilin HpsB [Anabaena subtropica]MBD2344461.1 type II secretion system protein [Anabaena subtropica FACHB-260]